MSTLDHLFDNCAPEALSLGVSGNGARITYAQLKQYVADVRDVLLQYGIRPSESVAVVIPNSVEFIVCYLAATNARAVACPLNSSYTADEFNFYLSDAEVKLVIVPKKGNEAAEKAAADLKIPVVSAVCDPATGAVTLEPKALSLGREPTKATPVEADDFAMFLHTSGTTSKPKCVQLTQANLMASLHHIMDWYELTAADRSYLVMPLFHVHGLMAATLATLLSGGMVCIPKEGKFSASTFWQGIQEFNCTWYTAVPTIHQILLLRAEKEYPKENPPKFRFIRSCSSSLAPAVLEKLEATFHAPVLEAYAMTEASHQMCSNPLPSHGVHKAGTVGLPTGIQLTILDPELHELGPRQPGEVCIKGENVTKGYRNRPEANVEAFAGGWFHTGDQGFLDEDGYLSLTGRIKELINRGGEKISPLEIDGVLLSHPSVSEAVCFGVPNEMYGEEVEAVVILKEGKTETADDIIAFCKERLSQFKVPKKVHVAKDIPRTATGKIQRRIVAAHFTQKQ